MDGASPPHRVADGGIPLRDTAGLPVLSLAIWSPDGHWIYYRPMLDGRNDFLAAAADGSGAEPLALHTAACRAFSTGRDATHLRSRLGPTRRAIETDRQA